MKTIMKTLLVSIASLSLMFSVNAGELTVNGTAKATYNAVSGASADNGVGVTNELNFTASGEMDNGYTWSYSMELDPSTSGTNGDKTGSAPGQAINDDTQITLKMNDMGTVKFCVSECGNNKKYAWDQSAYTSMSDTGYSEGIVYPDDMGSYASIQYHTPALPFGISGSVAHGNPKKDGQSGNTTATGGNSATEFSLTIAPVDGLTLTGSFMEQNLYTDGTINNGQKEQNGAYAITYALGNLTAGYGKSYKAPEIDTLSAGATTIEFYENTGFSLGYAVNDDLSISYANEVGERNYQTSSTETFDIEMDSVQVAYSLGGATLSLARAEYENAGFIQNKDVSETIIAMSFAF
ncbi:MAG: porin [Candidatus Pelagibacter sp.]